MEEENKKKRKKKAAGDGEARPERKKNWKEYVATAEDIKWFLADHILLRRNTVLGQVEYRIPEGDGFARSLNLPASTEWQPISDLVENSLWVLMSQGEKKVLIQDLRLVIKSDIVPAYNPFAEYLNSLPAWDRQSHILALSSTVMVAGDTDEQMLFYECLRKWLVGMVAGWLSEDTVNDVVLVLIGEQGIYKTTWFQHLLPPELQPYFHTKLNAASLSRDDRLLLTQSALICCEELDSMNTTEVNQLKASITARYISERRAYGHYHERRPHIASFCGTGNNLQFLTDPTGNRRWLPFEVESILSPRDHPFDYAGIFAEAYALYREGFPFWFTREEIRRLALHNQKYEAPRTEREFICENFRQPGPGEGEFFSVTTVMGMVPPGEARLFNKIRMGQAFAQLGYESKNRHGYRGYIAVRLTEAEKQSRRKALAMESDEVNRSTGDTPFG